MPRQVLNRSRRHPSHRQVRTEGVTQNVNAVVLEFGAASGTLHQPLHQPLRQGLTVFSAKHLSRSEMPVVVKRGGQSNRERHVA